MPTQSHLCFNDFKENLSGLLPWDLTWLKFPLNGLQAQSRVSPAVGLLPLASGPTCLGMAFPPFLVKQLYRCDSVVISSFVRIGYTTRRRYSSGVTCFNFDYKSKRRQKNNNSRDEIREKKSRLHLDRLQNKCTNFKGVKSNINFGKITGIQEKLETTCK